MRGKALLFFLRVWIRRDVGIAACITLEKLIAQTHQLCQAVGQLMGFQQPQTAFLCMKKITEQIKLYRAPWVYSMAFSVDIFDNINIPAIGQLFVILLNVIFDHLQAKQIVLRIFLVIREARAILYDHNFFTLNFRDKLIHANWIQNVVPAFFCYFNGICIRRKIKRTIEIKF